MKGKKLIFVFVGLILVVAGVLCIFLWPKNNEKEIYTNALKKSLGIDLGEVKETVTSEENLKKVQHTIIEGSVKTPDGTFTVKDDVYAMVGKAYMNLIASDGEKNINGVMLLENTRLYFTIKDYLQKYYYYDLDSMTDVVETNEVDFDYEKLLNIIKNDFYDSIDEKNIKTESVTNL